MGCVSMVGFTHRASVLRVLERVSVPHAEQDALLHALRAAGFPEAVVLSTCSRTEVYAGGSSASPQRLLDVLVERAGGWSHELREAAEVRLGDDAVRHLFRVTAGLDSRVVGEPEIRSQVRAAFRRSYAAGMARGTLGELFPAALRSAAAVRRRTTVVSQARSLACRAVEVGLRRPAPGHRPHVVVLGSGRMAAAAVEWLHRLGHRPVVVARSSEHALRLVGADRVRGLDALAAEVHHADLLVSTTAADHPLVTADLVRSVVGDGRRLTVVDLSVPRNVDPAVGLLEGLHLVDIEDLATDSATDPGLAAGLVHAEALVREAARRYAEHVAARRAGPLMTAMRARVQQVCTETLARTSPEMPEQTRAVHAHRLAGRLCHPAIMAARAAAAADDEATLLALGEAFAVDALELPQSLTTTYDAAVELISGLASHPGGAIGRSSGAETRTTTWSVVASTANRRPG